MGLVRCPDCGKMVSDLSPACVGCGRPLGGAAARTEKIPGPEDIELLEKDLEIAKEPSSTIKQHNSDIQQSNIVERLAFLKPTDAVVPFDDFANLILKALKPHDDIPLTEADKMPATDLDKLFQYACNQAGHWQAAWDCSPINSPNYEARDEAEKWGGICRQYSGQLVELASSPEFTKLHDEYRGLIVGGPQLKWATQYVKEHPIEGFLMLSYQRLGILLNKWGLHQLAIWLYQRGMYPKSVVGHPSNANRVAKL